ncbi:Sucrose-phosphatase 2 [Vitis vinifera]|uniref:Sucrose-phosphatase n=1 Tax=Vitis vinifera TaxID=29760 RepID=A0A438HZ46_VITVI|nr:Sucrose-phosphatase 2 [Vitis vinifera]
MDRLNNPARLMIVSDLDHTMVDHHDSENLSLLRFNALWEANYRHDSLLVFSTGRSPTLYKQLRKEKPMLTPDITIMSVGTEITYGNSMVPDNVYAVMQSETEQRPHKVSFYVDKDKARDVMRALSELLEKRGLDVKIIYSGGMDLDILPQGAGKGQALAYLLKKFKAEGKLPNNTLVCGDSGNDAELFSIPDVYGVMVSNAQEELLQWHAENAKNNPKIIHATERCASGIIQAIGQFSLGPNTSPRDLKCSSECKMEDTNPGHEIVKFYLFYERWRRAEVENSDQSLEKLKAVCKSLRVWVDRVSSAQISSDTWLVKFDKWELSEGCLIIVIYLMSSNKYQNFVGEEWQCCMTTVILRSRAASLSDGFTWMHVHQTWLEGSGAKDQTNWLF